MEQKTNAKKQITVNNENWFTRIGAAEQLGISVSSIKRYVNAKQLQAFKHPSIGVLFKQEWLDNWVERNFTKVTKAK